MNPHMDAVHDLHDLHRPGAPLSLTPQNEANYPGLGWSGVNVFTAPNTMICCTVYTKGVRKNNTSTYTNLSLKHCIVKCALYQHYAVFEY